MINKCVNTIRKKNIHVHMMTNARKRDIRDKREAIYLRMRNPKKKIFGCTYARMCDSQTYICKKNTTPEGCIIYKYDMII